MTGGLGAGKTEALAAFESVGAATISTDTIVHELLAAGEVRKLVEKRWGERALSGGEVDREKVAEIVFERPDELSWLEGVIFPRVGSRLVEWRRALEIQEPSPKLAVVEVPLLFEANIEGMFDATVAVVANEQNRSERASTRGQAAVEGRLSRQLPQEEKARRADHVILNDGTIADLKMCVERLASQLLAA